MAYFDHNATAPVSSEVAEAVATLLRLTVIRRRSMQRGALPELRWKRREKESPNWSVPNRKTSFLPVAPPKRTIRRSGVWPPQGFASAIEHPSVLEVAPDDDRIPVSADGVTDLDALSEMLKRRGRLVVVSVMAANNESGVIQPVKTAAESAFRWRIVPLRCRAGGWANSV